MRHRETGLAWVTAWLWLPYLQQFQGVIGQRQVLEHSDTIWFLFSVYWDYALVVPFSQIVCIHCHQQSECACLRHRGGTNTVFLLHTVHGAC